MSKNLFNQNTFGDKNVVNDDDITIANATTIAAKTITTTDLTVAGTLTNTELQNATTNIATNTTNIATNTTNIATNITNIASNTSNIATANARIVGNINDIATANTNIATNASNIANNATNIATNTTAISGKQDTLTTGDGIDITGTTITFDGTISQDITSGGDIQGVNLKYIDGGVVTDVKTKIDTNATAITGKQATITSGSVDANLIFQAGSNLSFDAATTPHTLNATSSTYGVLTHGGLAINGSNEFSLDFSNTNATITIPQNVEITSGNDFNAGTGAFYHTPRMVIYRFDKDEVTNDLWGGDNISDTVKNTLLSGVSFCSILDGVITISVSGFYRIKYQATVENDGQNDRMTVGVGMKKDSTSYWKQDNKSFFGAAYLRDDSFGDMASFQFEDYIDITASDELRFLTKINLGSNTGFSDQTAKANLDWFGSVTIELIKPA